MRNLVISFLLGLALTGCSATPSVSTNTQLPTEVPVPQREQPVDSHPTTKNVCSLTPGWTLLKSEVVGGDHAPQARYLMGGRDILAEGPDGRLWQYSLSDEGKRSPLGTKPYRNFSLSTSGKQLAGIVEENIWLLDLETGKELDAGIKAKSVLAWHPDSNSLYFLAERGIGELSLKTGEVLWHLEKGDPANDVSKQRFFQWPNATGGDLSADGKQLLLTAGHSGTGAIYRLDLVTGALHWYGKTEGDAFSAHWHPNHRHVLYSAGRKALDIVNEEISETGVPAIGLLLQDVTETGQMLVLSGEGGMWCWYSGTIQTFRN